MHRGSLIIAVLTIALGLVVVLAALGMFPVSEEGFAAPPWVVGLAGGAFLTAGLLLLLTLRARSDGALPQETQTRVFLRGGFTILLLSIFAVLTHWMAFGAGARNLTTESADVLPALSASLNGVVGRAVFMAGALLVDGLLVLGIIDLIRRMTRWQTRPD